MKQAALAVFCFVFSLACSPLMSVALSKTFDSAGVPIDYVVSGTGQPVVLLHGLNANAQMNWDFPGIVDLLSSSYQVIALDLRGHGSSGKPTEEDAYGVAMVEDVVRLLDHLKIEKAHLVGYSMGGMIAMKLMTLHPERVRSCALCGMGWLREGSPQQAFWERIEGREGSRTSDACFRGIGKLAVTEEAVEAIRVPVTVIVGDRDPVKRLYVEPLAAVRGDWPVVEISSAGHLICILKDQFKAEVKKWLDKNSL